MGLFGPNINKMLKEKDAAGLKKVVLENQNIKTRTKAIEALAVLKETETLTSLMTDPSLLPILVTIFAQMGDEAVEPLIKALSNEDYYIQGGAATALSLIGDYRALDPIIKKVNNKDSRARISMIVALGKFGGEDAKDTLRKASRDKNLEVSNAAMLALGEILNKGM